MTMLLEAGERTEDYCHIEVDTTKQQGFVSDSDISSTFAGGLVQPIECVWVIRVPVSYRVSYNSHDFA